METGGKSDGEVQDAVTPKRFAARPSSRAPDRSPATLPRCISRLQIPPEQSGDAQGWRREVEMQVSSLLPAGSLSIAVADGEAAFYRATVDNATEDPSLQVARARP